MLHLPTSSKVKVMIRGVDLDLAFRLDWKEAQPRIPIYGYNDQEYTRTISGRKLIQGFLVMNYVAPHYLSSVLGQEDFQRRQQQKIDAETELLETLPPAINPADRKARAEMISSKLFQEANSLKNQDGPRDYRAEGKYGTSIPPPPWVTAPAVPGPNVGPLGIKDVLMDQFANGGGLTKVAATPLFNPFDFTKPFPMEVYHIEPEFAPWYLVLEDVEITDISQTMSAAGADGSSDPLFETYEFIAKRRTIYRTRTSRKG